MSKEEAEPKRTVQLIAAKSVKSDSRVSEAELSIRSYFSVKYLEAASHFVELLADEEKKPQESANMGMHQAYALGVVMTSTAFVEAAVNEMYQDVAECRAQNWQFPEGRVAEVLGATWEFMGGRDERARLEYKISTAIQVAGSGKFDPGENPFQDFKLALKIRNELVHYKPLTQSSKEQHGLADDLKNRSYQRNPRMADGNPEFPDKFLGLGGCSWLLDSCVAFADDFFKRMGAVAPYQRNRES